MKLNIFLFISLLSISCTTNNGDVNEGFLIKGMTKSLADGTTIYLEDKYGEVVIMIDSAAVANNTFMFKGQLKDGPRQMRLRTRDYCQVGYIWLEHSTIIFDATQSSNFGAQSNFAGAKITGSHEQSLSDQLGNIGISYSDENALALKTLINKNPHSTALFGQVQHLLKTPFWSKSDIVPIYELFPDDVRESTYGLEFKSYLDQYDDEAEDYFINHDIHNL